MWFSSSSFFSFAHGISCLEAVRIFARVCLHGTETEEEKRVEQQKKKNECLYSYMCIIITAPIILVQEDKWSEERFLLWRSMTEHRKPVADGLMVYVCRLNILLGIYFTFFFSFLFILVFNEMLRLNPCCTLVMTSSIGRRWMRENSFFFSPIITYCIEDTLHLSYCLCAMCVRSDAFEQTKQ